YEPELHPGVTYKIKEFKATLKIYSTGSITVNAPSEEIVQLAIEHIYPLILPFKLTNLLNDKCLVKVIKGRKSQEENTGILEDNGRFHIHHRPVEGLVIKRWKLPKLEKK
ncbi:PREDICTED: TATA box-binding protein-like protein 1, partial [Diuraphis noxia]